MDNEAYARKSHGLDDDYGWQDDSVDMTDKIIVPAVTTVSSAGRITTGGDIG